MSKHRPFLPLGLPRLSLAILLETVYQSVLKAYPNEIITRDDFLTSSICCGLQFQLKLVAERKIHGMIGLLIEGLEKQSRPTIN